MFLHARHANDHYRDIVKYTPDVDVAVLKIYWFQYIGKDWS